MGSLSNPIEERSSVRKMLRRSVVAAAVAASLAVSACAKAPRGRPIPTTRVDTGAGTLESVRRQLEGEWDLVSLTIVQKPGGAPVEVKAKALLTYDAYGNMTLKGRFDDQRYADPAAAPFLDFSGRAVIDVPRSQLRILDAAANVEVAEEALPKETSFDKVRQYTFEGDVLKLSTIDAQGHVTATATWKKRGA